MTARVRSGLDRLRHRAAGDGRPPRRHRRIARASRAPPGPAPPSPGGSLRAVMPRDTPRVEPSRRGRSGRSGSAASCSGCILDAVTRRSGDWSYIDPGVRVPRGRHDRPDRGAEAAGEPDRVDLRGRSGCSSGSSSPPLTRYAYWATITHPGATGRRRSSSGSRTGGGSRSSECSSRSRSCCSPTDISHLRAGVRSPGRRRSRSSCGRSPSRSRTTTSPNSAGPARREPVHGPLADPVLRHRARGPRGGVLGDARTFDRVPRHPVPSQPGRRARADQVADDRGGHHPRLAPLPFEHGNGGSGRLHPGVRPRADPRSRSASRSSSTGSTTSTWSSTRRSSTVRSHASSPSSTSRSSWASARMVGASTGTLVLSAVAAAVVASRSSRFAARAAPRRPGRLRQARDAVRGARRVLGSLGRLVRDRRPPTTDGADARRGDRRSARRRVAADREHSSVPRRRSGDAAPLSPVAADCAAARRSWPVPAYQGELLGGLSIAKRSGETHHPDRGEVRQRPLIAGGTRAAQRPPDRGSERPASPRRRLRPLASGS